MINKDMPIYGIWNVAGNCWILNDYGFPFKTIYIDVALDAYNNFLKEGVLPGSLMVSVMDFDTIITN